MVNGFFVVVDFEIGVTKYYQVHFTDKELRWIAEFSDFFWATGLISIASGVHGIVATSSGINLVLWDIVGGIIHRCRGLAEFRAAASV
jgi:hypothetical protein